MSILRRGTRALLRHPRVPGPMPIRTPTIVNRGSLSYFFDSENMRWRVYDSSEEPYQNRPYRQIFALGDPQATVRCFAPADKTAAHYVFTFQSDADRAVTADALSAQLSASRPFYRRLYYTGAGNLK
jgi:hypothetical protein